MGYLREDRRRERDDLTFTAAIAPTTDSKRYAPKSAARIGADTSLFAPRINVITAKRQVSVAALTAPHISGACLTALAEIIPTRK